MKKVLLLPLTLGTTFAVGFQGFYAGGQAGFAHLKGNHKFNKTVNGSDSEGTQKVKPIGLIAGLHGGYSYDWNKIIIGGELNWLVPFFSDKENLQTEGGPTEGKVRVKHRYSVGLSAFVGTLVSPKWLPYLRLGREFATLDLKYEELTFGSSKQFKRTRQNMVSGLGVSYLWDPSIVVGAEYTYIKMDKYEPQKRDLDSTRRGFRINPSQHRLMFKVSYQFQ